MDSHSKTPGRGRAVAKNLVAFAVSVLICLFLTEGAVRVFLPQFLRPVLRERVDGLFCLRADLDARIFSPGEFDTRIKTTSQRFRGDEEFTRTPPHEVARIAILGDSFAFGNGVNDEESYPAVLADALNDETVMPGRVPGVPGGATRFEVLNTGIPNSGTGDQALWYEHWVKDFAPHLVVLTVYGGNDVWDEIQDSKFELTPSGAVPMDREAVEARGGLEAKLQSAVLKIPGYMYLTQHSHLLYAVRTAVTVSFSRRVDTKGRTLPTASDDDPKADLAIDKIAAEIHWLRQRVEASGAEFVIVFIPQRNEFLEQTRESRGSHRSRSLAARVRHEADRADISYLDLTAAVASRLARNPGTLYYLKDDHMRPDGYRLVGEEVAHFLLNGVPAS